MNLASIRRIAALNPIPNADQIEVATIDGWQVVVRKGEFKENDLCVYFQIDSFLPDKPEFAFLKSKKKMGEVEGYRLRTIKLRGQISQGLALPLKDFPELLAEHDTGYPVYAMVSDVTEILGVLKYEKPISAQLAGQAKGYLPSFLRKTDEERIQNIPDSDLTVYMNNWFVHTKKRDGSSMTVFAVKLAVSPETIELPIENNEFEYRFGVCSRNLELKETEGNAFWIEATRLHLHEVLPEYCANVQRSLAFQGELFGEGIQKNPHKLKGLKFEIFNIWDIDKQEYLSFDEVQEILKELKDSYSVYLEYVPVSIIGPAPLFMFGNSREALLALADEDYAQPDGSFNEGHVYKSQYRIDGKIISFKVISNKYLLEVEE